MIYRYSEGNSLESTGDEDEMKVQDARENRVMRQCWLRPNLRVMWMGLIFPVLLTLGGLILALRISPSGSLWLLTWIGWGATILGVLLIGLLIYFSSLPRLAYEDGQLLVYLQSLQPIRIPIEVVECFFFGQAPSMLQGKKGEDSETSTVVVRLAESASRWRSVEVKPALGHWCDGYIVVRGTWTEPIDDKLIERLNANLVAAHRRQRQTSQAKTV